MNKPTKRLEELPESERALIVSVFQGFLADRRAALVENRLGRLGTQLHPTLETVEKRATWLLGVCGGYVALLMYEFNSLVLLGIGEYLRWSFALVAVGALIGFAVRARAITTRTQLKQLEVLSGLAISDAEGDELIRYAVEGTERYFHVVSENWSGHRGSTQHELQLVESALLSGRQGLTAAFIKAVWKSIATAWRQEAESVEGRAPHPGWFVLVGAGLQLFAVGVAELFAVTGIVALVFGVLVEGL